ncbi:MAG TPA: glycosyltransferase, partial [Nitrospirae bacterium]|nr:glycosyltransferase [Nitrospirota bacterium]
TPMPPKDALIICYVGRISQEKGINGFIQAWLKCKKEHDSIIVAGSGTGVYFEEFNRLKKMSEGAVIYKGYIDEAGVEEVIYQSHFLVLASGRENFGNAVAEALALGRPVMVTRGLSWNHIEDEGIGFLFDRNADSICDAIRRAQNISDAALNQMSGTAYHYAMANLGASGLANKLWNKMNE